MLVFPAIVLPLAHLNGLPMAQVLGFSFWMYLLFGVSALPWGLLGDWLGGKPLMMIMFLGAGLGGLGAALFIDQPDMFTLCLAGIGLSSAIYHPIGLGMISKGVSRMSVAMGYNAMCGGLGLVMAPLVTGLVNWLSGPKAAYMVLAAANLTGFGLMMLLPLGDDDASSTAKAQSDNGLLGAFLILLVAMMLGGIAYRGATVILPAYLELKGQGILEGLSYIAGRSLSGNLVATTVTAIIYCVGMFGQYVGGHVGDRYENRYAYLVFHAICIVPAFLMAYTYNLPLVALALVYFFFLLGMQPIENTLVATFTPRRLHHSAFGMKFILTFGVGALAVKMIQKIEATWGVEASFIALGITSVLIVVTILALLKQTAAEQVEHHPEEQALVPGMHR
jgi:MFS family permease